MFCGKCGKQIKDDSKFCGYCGAQLAGANVAAAMPQRRTLVLETEKRASDGEKKKIKVLSNLKNGHKQIQGNSVSWKCVASAWNMPLLRLDMGKIFQGIVGSSESNIRLALKTAEAISPSILWIDEIEKGLSGSGGNGGDGGTSTRVFGTLLTWMQEKTSPVFVFATANNINGLPPELLRKGRFDEIFFVDFPSNDERKKILEIHISKLKRDLNKFDLNKLSKLSGEEKFGKDVVLSGAELEAWVADSLIEAFSRKIEGDSNADLSMDDFETTINRLVPMGQMRKDEFTRLRHWANENAVSASVSSVSNANNEAFIGGRRIDF